MRINVKIAKSEIGLPQNFMRLKKIHVKSSI